MFTWSAPRRDFPVIATAAKVIAAASRAYPHSRWSIRQDGVHGQCCSFAPGARCRRRRRRARVPGARPAAVRIRRLDGQGRRRGAAQRHRDQARRDRAGHQHAGARRRQRRHRAARDGQRRPGLRAVGAQLGRRPGRRSGGGRRRLPGQAIRAGRAGGAGEGAAAPQGRDRDVLVGDDLRRPARGRHPRPPRPRQRRRRRPDQARVRPAGRAGRTQDRRAVPGPAAGAGVGLRLRRRHQRGRRVHRLPPPQAGGRRRAPAAAHRPRRGVRAAGTQ